MEIKKIIEQLGKMDREEKKEQTNLFLSGAVKRDFTKCFPEISLSRFVESVMREAIKQQKKVA